MATNKKTKYLNAHRGCPGGPKCHHCTWDSLHICVRGPYAKYIKGQRAQYRGDIDGAIDDFLATLKLEARRLLPGMREGDACTSTVSFEVQLTGESEFSMPHDIIQLDGVIGKTVEKITVTNESDFRVITVRFADRSAIHFTLHPRIEIEPELVDWTMGDGETLKEYPTICEHEQ